MPMLALLLLCAGLFGRDADAGDASLRSQILQADAGRAGMPPAHEPTALQLFRLRQDRVLRVGNQRPPAGGQQHQAGSARFAQVWERVDGHWRLQRMISIDEWVAQR
ncbi:MULTISPECIES: hypothetical protein [Stenotrophomonas]|uniref:DUF4440 domain-containing protein n=1 Tax=Stenotrophomonas maltophilia TaxID=40324 RepID=A0A2J0T0I8_STEMA|nr:MULTISPECIES: hypothetical protein [Stenotrophomonas]MBA0311163.1 hypothetical protein [Stenotrophomonas maltophilia]MBH1408942.1 hypothetical protein [Stenotrophomonas maltophilia]MBH1867174.1 hypothetical protein [Stenotrophomonas maltophilia]MDH1388556.1 hypothetical protein [Stenotrophomonas sp. GD03701]MDH1392087.1 hypothetical protein [Stenotrophomonas sp. GD03702]